MGYQTIIYETGENITTITLNRPDKLNAFNLRMSQEIIDACERVNADPDVRVMILRGAGRSFSAGHDINEMMTHSDQASENQAVYPRDWIGLVNYEKKKYLKSHNVLRDVKVPTICQVHGYCLVGGFYLANCCDLMVASEDAKFSDWAAKFGPIGVEELYEIFYMPIRKAKELLFTGQIIDAQEAYRLGVVNKVVPLEKLDEEVRNLAKSIAVMNPGVTQALKLSINNAMDIMGYRSVNAAHFTWHLAGHFGDWHVGGEGKEGIREHYVKITEEKGPGSGVREFIRDLHEKGSIA